MGSWKDRWVMSTIRLLLFNISQLNWTQESNTCNLLKILIIDTTHFLSVAVILPVNIISEAWKEVHIQLV